MAKELDLTYERALLKRLNEDDSDAYKEVYSKTYPMVYSYMRNNSGNEADARECMQEGFTRLLILTNNPLFVLTCKVSTLLFTICRFVWLNELRRRRGQKNQEDHPPEFETVTLNLLELGMKDSEEEIRFECAKKCLELLGEPCKRMIEMRFLEGKKHEEIAAVFNFSVGYCRLKLHRCMESLKMLANACVQMAN